MGLPRLFIMKRQAWQTVDLVAASTSWPHTCRQRFPWRAFPPGRHTRRGRSSSFFFFLWSGRGGADCITNVVKLAAINTMQSICQGRGQGAWGSSATVHVCILSGWFPTCLAGCLWKRDMCAFTWRHLILPFATIKSPSIWRKGPSKKKETLEMIKWTISGGPWVPLPSGPQIRPPALPLENRLRTQRKLLSAALPHLPGLHHSLSPSPTLPVSEIKHRRFHRSAVRIPRSVQLHQAATARLT